MASASSSKPDEPALTATYNSPAGTKVFKHSIAALSSAETEAKVTYLSELRASSKRLQDNINTFLTAKMEEDKATATATATASTNGTGARHGKKGGPSEEEAENTYGEENEDESS